MKRGSQTKQFSRDINRTPNAARISTNFVELSSYSHRSSPYLPNTGTTRSLDRGSGLATATSNPTGFLSIRSTTNPSASNAPAHIATFSKSEIPKGPLWRAFRGPFRVADFSHLGPFGLAEASVRGGRPRKGQTVSSWLSQVL